MKLTEEQEQEKKLEAKRELNSYAQYSSLGFQMLAVIAIFMFIGYKIDRWRASDQLIFTAVLGMFGVCASLYLIISSLKNKKP